MKDNSPYIAQRNKLKGKLNIYEKIPWTPKQKELFELVGKKETKIVFVNGPAGSSKTICAVYSALKLLNECRISDIVYLRAALESSNSPIGWLPGTSGDKIQPYIQPLEDKLCELLPQEDIVKLKKEERVSGIPVGFLRGLNWNAKAIIIDEAQSLVRKELITILTRLGEFSKCFVLADPFQSDLPPNKTGAFMELVSLFNNEESRAMGIHTFEFTKEDIVRSALVKFLIEKFEQLKPQNGNGNGH